jgi:prolyl-tRNA synthetase
MRWSKMFIPTLREDPANAEAVSHRLLMRAGYIRQLTSGVYLLLPLAQLVRQKIIAIIRQEMNRIGANEFLLSALQPIEIWEESGRLSSVSDVIFRLKDRKGSELALGLTHEEVFTSIARTSLVSYRQLPQMWYQIQTKFRDEARPKGGLLRVREFTMKDSYSFDINEAGLDQSFDLHRTAYERIFNRCELKFRAVQADSGAMGGNDSVEFMVETSAGEDVLVLCSECGYGANLEKACSRTDQHCADHEQDVVEGSAELLEFATPGIRTIRALAEFVDFAPADRQLKTLVYKTDRGLIIAVVRGDQELNEAKLRSALMTSILEPASEEEIHDAMGAYPGSLGACGVIAGEGKKISVIVADPRVQGKMDMVTGANKDDVHLKNVMVSRDIAVDRWVDLHLVKGGEACTICGGILTLAKGLEIGHIFKLGSRYSSIMDAQVLGADGNRQPILMGSYGIGVERLMAAVVELYHDQQGLKWPLSVAPFSVLIVPLNMQDRQQMEAAESIYQRVQDAQMDALFDDREERAGVKFNDADLIGVPYRITIGRKISTGIVELFDRHTKSSVDVAVDQILEKLVELVRPA